MQHKVLYISMDNNKYKIIMDTPQNNKQRKSTQSKGQKKRKDHINKRIKTITEIKVSKIMKQLKRHINKIIDE